MAQQIIYRLPQSTNSGAATIPAEGYLVQKKRAELMQDILNMVLESEQPYLKVGSYLEPKKVFNIGAGFFSHPNGSAIADAAGNLMVRM
jgi:hypothetical protein